MNSLRSKDELVLLFKNGLFKKASQFCQFNFIERIYGLAGPPQQLEFVTVPLAPRDLSSSFPFFSFTRQTLGLLNAFNDVCHYEHSIAAHKTVCYIHSFSFEKKGEGWVGREVVSNFYTPRDSVDHYFSRAELYREAKS